MAGEDTGLAAGTITGVTADTGGATGVTTGAGGTGCDAGIAAGTTSGEAGGTTTGIGAACGDGLVAAVASGLIVSFGVGVVVDVVDEATDFGPAAYGLADILAFVATGTFCVGGAATSVGDVRVTCAAGGGGGETLLSLGVRFAEFSTAGCRDGVVGTVAGFVALVSSGFGGFNDLERTPSKLASATTVSSGATSSRFLIVAWPLAAARRAWSMIVAIGTVSRRR
jgi:hypothetical protein